MSIRTKLVLFLLFLFTLAIANAFLTFKMEAYAEEKSAWVEHTHEVLTETETFLGALKDAETGQRGFLLTKNKHYLEPYNLGLVDAKDRFKTFSIVFSIFIRMQLRLVYANEFLSGASGEQLCLPIGI